MIKSFTEMYDEKPELTESNMARKLYPWWVAYTIQGKIPKTTHMCRFLGITLDKTDPKFGQHHGRLKRIWAFLQYWCIDNNLPDITKNVRTVHGEFCHDSRQVTQHDIFKLFEFDWYDYPMPTRVQLEKTYAPYHPYSISASNQKRLLAA